MGESGDRVASAGLLLGALLLALSVPWPGGPAPPCREPAEAVGDGIRSLDVRCGATPEPRRPVRGAARLLFGQTLDLNCAEAADLESLPGIGPARAAAIVSARPFFSLAGLVRVRGIGARTVEGLKGWAEVVETSGDETACPSLRQGGAGRDGDAWKGGP